MARYNGGPDRRISLNFMQENPGSLLVFPATAEAGIDIPEMMLERGERLILASSVMSRLDLGASTLPVERLPMIHAENFEAEFKALIERNRVRRVYCPITSVFARLEALVDGGNVKVALIGQSPHRRVIETHRNLTARAKSLYGFASICAEPLGGRTQSELNALLLLTRQIYGESNDDKMAGLFAAMACAVPGDVVEIGALMGKSAVGLGFLANLNGIGPLLTIDPWLQDCAVQTDSPQMIQALAGAWDLNDVFDIFRVNLHLLPKGTANYLRSTSAKAGQDYGPGFKVKSAEFGTTAYSGSISLLHVDGNHDYRAVLEDCRIWLPRMAERGWVILDDYFWAHGDGPRRVGDALLSACGAEVEHVFVSGKALFIRLTGTRQLKRWAESI